MDYLAIAAALAARYDPIQTTITAPSGEQQIRGSTHLMPEALGGVLPQVVVWPPTVTDIKYGASLRMATLRFPVRFYYKELASDNRDYGHLYDWMTALQDQMIQATHITLPTYVAMAWLESVVPGDLDYAGKGHVGIEFTVMVKTSEGIQAVA